MPPEEPEVSPSIDEGLAVEPASQETFPPVTPVPAQEPQSPIQTPEPAKAPVEAPGTKPTSNGTPGRLPSNFYNKRKTDAINARFDALEKRIESYLTRREPPPAPTVPPLNGKPTGDDLKKKYWEDPYDGTRSIVSDELKAFQEKIKQEIASDIERTREQEKFNTSLREADRLVLTNERSKTNPNFKDDIIAIFQKYQGLQRLAVADPVAATTEAFELYDILIKGEAPRVPVPKKGQMASTQTAVRANGAGGEEALLAELKQITESLTPLNASDPKIVQRMKEIDAALDQL